MLTQLFAYIFYFFASTGSTLQRRHNAQKTKAHPIALLVRVQVLIAIVCYVFLFRETQPFHLTWGLLEKAVLSGVCSFVCYSLLYMSHKHVDATEGVILSNVYTPVAIFLSGWLLHESLTPLQRAGTCLLLAAVLIISLENPTRIKIRINKYFFMMLLGGVALSGTLVIEKHLMNTMGNYNAIVLNRTVQALVLIIGEVIMRSAGITMRTPTHRELLITTIRRFGQMLSRILLVIVVGNLAVVSAVTTFKIVITFIASYFILGEKTNLWQKGLGALVATVGLLLMR